MPIISRSPVDDQRRPLDKARRPQLVAFAHENGQMDINEQMPAEYIRLELKRRGLTNIKVQRRPLGSIGQEYMGKRPEHDLIAPGRESGGRAVTADEHVRQQYLAQQARERARKDIAVMSINQLRDACKARGIKMSRTDTTQTLRDKLNGENAA